MTPRLQHPDWETILAHVERGDDPGVAAHCAACPRCARNAEALRGLLSALEDARLPEIPMDLLERTLASLQLSPAVAGVASGARDSGAVLEAWIARLGRPVRAVIAVLMADSYASPATSLRGTGATRERTLFYEAGACRLALQLADTESGSRSLRGQMMTSAGQVIPPATRAAVASADGLAEYPLSDLGEFEIPSLPGDATSVSILIADQLIRIDLPS